MSSQGNTDHRHSALSRTGRLAGSYLLVIMTMSLGYSYVLYAASAHELERQRPPDALFQANNSSNTSGGGRDDDGSSRSGYDDFFDSRVAEGRHTLLARLAMLNAVTLVAGGGLSYYLARRTLAPIERSMEAQGQFVSDASHELRTPLTAMRTSNEVALRDPALTLARSKQLLCDNIDDVVKLQTLTDSLLALATQDAAEVVLRPVSLQDIANEAMNRVVGQAQAKSMSVDDTVPAIVVMADHQTIVQAVVVLLDNAIKYGPQGSTVKLRGFRRGKQGSIQVRDQGPGIPPTDVRRIFDRFYRADQSRSAQHVPGHGIGLSLAKKIVEQQGGSIDVSSVVGKGSAFRISLPLA